MSERTVLGWREWIGLPELETGATLAKMDTGAWSNTLHAEEISLTNNGMEQIVKFFDPMFELGDANIRPIMSMQDALAAIAKE